ncbi:FHA domain-containing protein [Agromyces sp. CCNWLW203]|uniref:FHA domain-containing protein n=1 Tax=Agromyces sp. CCNWLW203 TaxID=3112842 RepID=UPI002F962809
MATYRHDSEAAWFAAVRGGVILVVPVEAVDRLAALWPELGTGDPTSLVLDRLTAQGLAATPSFALVVRDEAAGTARVVVRGPISVRSAADEIHDAGVSTWVERVLDGGSAIEVVVDGGADASAPELPVVEAVVPLRSIVSDGIEPVAPVRSIVSDGIEPVAPVRSEAATGAAPAPEAPAADAAPGPAAKRAKPAAAAPAPAAPAPAAPAPPAPAPAPPAPAAAAPVAPAAPAPATPPLTRVTAPVELTMVPDEETIAGPSSAFTNGLPPAPPAAPSAAPPAPVDGDHDGMTVASIDIKRLREQRAARASGDAPDGVASADTVAPMATVAPVSTAATQASIRMPDGTLEAIGHEVVLGRAPSVSKVSGGRIPRLITIGLGDPDISRSHVRLALEGDTVVITDLHSRNGTHVVAPGKAPVKLRSGEPTPVLTGTVVDLGGGWTIQVVGG